MKKPKYDWRSVPYWAQYVALDSDGDMCAYESKPEMHSSGLFWKKHIGGNCLKIKNIGPCENWKDSLEERPKTLCTKEEIEDVVKMVLLDNGIDYGTEVRFFNIASDCAEAIIRRLGIKP